MHISELATAAVVSPVQLEQCGAFRDLSVVLVKVSFHGTSLIGDSPSRTEAAASRSIEQSK